MANKKKNLPFDLLEEAIFECRGIISDIVRYLHRMGYTCYRQTVMTYIELYELEDKLEEARVTMTDDTLGKLYDKVESGDNYAISLVLRTHGDKIGFIPEKAVKDYDHRQKLDLLERQEAKGKETLEEYRKLIEQSEKYPFQK